MLFRHILGYGPANLVPAVISFGSIYVFTRLVSPGAYGDYALVGGVALLCQAVVFYWLQVGTMRFVAAAAKDGNLGALSATVYRGYLALALLFAAAYGL